MTAQTVPSAAIASPQERAAATPAPRLGYGRVVQVEGPTYAAVQGAPVAGRFAVELDGAVVSAVRAVSCLVEPAVGDRVLASSPDPRACDSGGLWFLLAVVERSGQSQTVLSTDGDLAIRLPSGKLDLAARDGAKVTTAGAVDVAATSVEVSALSTTVTSDKLTLGARAATISAAGLNIAAEAIDTVADRVTEKVKRAYRTIEELDQLRARCADYIVKEALRIHSKHTVVSADEAAKIDAKNVYLG